MMSADKTYLYGLGEKLKILREARHFSQAEVAKKLGIAPVSMSAYKNAKSGSVCPADCIL